MDNDLLVSIPDGFDPEGLRVYQTRHGVLGLIGVVVGPGMFEDTRFAIHPAGIGFDRCVGVDARLSLADARTRDALARWVAGQEGLPSELSTAPIWWSNRIGPEFVWCIGSEPARPARRAFGAHPAHNVTPLLALALLDLGDPDATLPDGSFRRDALALAVVVRHLAEAPRG